MRLQILVVALLLGLCPFVRGEGEESGKATPLTPELRKAIEGLVAPRIASEHLVGVSIGVIDGDRQGTLGFGRMAYGDPRVPDADTVFEIASASKTFTGVLLAHAVEDSLLSLDDPVQKHLPDGVTMPFLGETPITLMDLSTHRSGLPRMPGNFAPGDPDDPYADYDAERMFAFLSGFIPARGPGVKSEYSNLAVGLLGHILGSKADGYAALVEAKITGPLGMTSTSIALSEDQTNRFAPPHRLDTSPSYPWTFKALAGAGGIRSTVSDMLRYARAHIEPEDTPLGRAMRMATAKQAKMGEEGASIGLGWIIAQTGVRWHNGQTGGYHSFVGMEIEKRRAVVVLSNTATPLVDTLGNEVLRLLAGMDVAPPEIEPQHPVKPEFLERYEGVYTLSPMFKLTVTAEDSRLFVQATNQPRLRVFPESDTEFVYRIVEARLVFEVEGDGPAKSVVLHQGGGEMRATRE